MNMCLLNMGLLNTGLLNTGLLNNENDFAIENPLLGAQRAPPKEFGSDWSLGCREMSDLSGYRWYHIGYIIGIGIFVL